MIAIAMLLESKYFNNLEFTIKKFTTISQKNCSFAGTIILKSTCFENRKNIFCL